MPWNATVSVPDVTVTAALTLVWVGVPDRDHLEGETVVEGADGNESVDEAWASFQRRLADHFAAMQVDDFVIFDWHEARVTDGAEPFVQFLRWSKQFMRAEVVSNAYLAPRYRHTPQDEDMLCALGWKRPTYLPGDPGDGGSPSFYVDRKMRKTRRLAALTVTTLRMFWGVPHPRMLRATISGSLEGTDPIGVGARSASSRHNARRILERVSRVVEEALGVSPEFGNDEDPVLILPGHRISVVEAAEGAQGPTVRVSASDNPATEGDDLPVHPFDSRRLVRLLAPEGW